MAKLTEPPVLLEPSTDSKFVAIVRAWTSGDAWRRVRFETIADGIDWSWATHALVTTAKALWPRLGLLACRFEVGDASIILLQVEVDASASTEGFEGVGASRREASGSARGSSWRSSCEGSSK